jgi:hypothetical protein
MLPAFPANRNGGSRPAAPEPNKKGQPFGLAFFIWGGLTRKN